MRKKLLNTNPNKEIQMTQESEKPEDKTKASLVQIDMKDNNDKGIVQISDNVLAAIVKKYAFTIDGVVRPAPQSLVDGITSMFSRKGYDSNMNFEMTDDGVIITLALIMRFGVNVPEISKEIQDILFAKIPALSGYPVSKVNINIVGLEEVEDDTDDEATIVSSK